MQEIFAQFLHPSDQSVNHGGQIFAIPSSVATHIEEPQEELVQESNLTLRQKQALEALFLFHQATADLLLRYLRLSPNSLRHLQKQLAALHPPEEKERYVEFIIPPKPHSSRFGSSPYIYTLGRRGYRYLKKQGFPVGRYRTDGVREEISLHHRLAVNEFLLNALLLTEDHPQDVQLLTHLHEQYWNGNPLKVQLPEEEKPVGLSPDLLLAFETYQPLNQHWLPIEINLSREWEKDWEKKVISYCYCLPAYRQRLGTDILTTVAVMVVSPTAFPRTLFAAETPELIKEREIEAARRLRRMETLKRWTEKLLEKMHLREEADLFSFSCAPLDELTPTELF